MRPLNFCTCTHRRQNKERNQNRPREHDAPTEAKLPPSPLSLAERPPQPSFSEQFATFSGLPGHAQRQKTTAKGEVKRRLPTAASQEWATQTDGKQATKRTKTRPEQRNKIPPEPTVVLGRPGGPTAGTIPHQTPQLGNPLSLYSALLGPSGAQVE